jgi:hypothetical protein
MGLHKQKVSALRNFLGLDLCELPTPLKSASKPAAIPTATFNLMSHGRGRIEHSAPEETYVQRLKPILIATNKIIDVRKFSSIWMPC